MHGAEKEIDYFGHKSLLTMPANILIRATNPVWIPVNVGNSIIGMPILGVMAKSIERMKFGNYQKNPHAHMEKRSKKFLASLTKIDALRCAEWMMEKTAEKITNYILTSIEGNRKMVSQLRDDTRSQDKVVEHYSSILQECLETRKNILNLGIKLCPATVNPRDLDWKEDTQLCIGEGEFSWVYRGMLKNGRRHTTLDANLILIVAVKVFKKQFDDSNLRLYLNEEMMIRYVLWIKIWVSFAINSTKCWGTYCCIAPYKQYFQLKLIIPHRLQGTFACGLLQRIAAARSVFVLFMSDF